MLQISPKTISLHTFQKRYNIKLFNRGEEALIFKIFSNNWSNLQLDINAGFLRPHTRLQPLITVLKRQPFQAKLQITYGVLKNSNERFQEAWKRFKTTSNQIKNEVINVYLREEGQQETQELQDSEYIRAKSLDNKNRTSFLNINRQSRYVKVGLPKLLPSIKEDLELQYLLQKGVVKDEESMKKVLNHMEQKRKKLLDAEQREELVFQLEQIDRRYKYELNRSERLTQQLQVAQKKLQNQSVQMLKFQVSHSLGVVCEEYHTSFAGLTILALACFLLGYALAIL